MPNAWINRRTLCAAAGIAVAVAGIVFTASLAATNRAQGVRRAIRACAPWAMWQKADVAALPCAGADTLPFSCVALTIDYRPGGRVLQGPPVRALLAKAPPANPYSSVTLSSGRWPNDTSGEYEVVCVLPALRRLAKAPPKLGEKVKFIARGGAVAATIVGYLDGAMAPPPVFPNVFASRAVCDALAAEEHSGIVLYREGAATKIPGAALNTPEDVADAFKGDDERRMDYAKPLMILAAILTALALLVNSLLLGVESNRRTLGMYRMAGMTRGGVLWLVTREALAIGFSGWFAGTLGAIGALAAFVALSKDAFPSGLALDGAAILATLFCLPVVVFAALLFVLGPALRVRPLDAIERAALRRRRRGMIGAFAAGFGAFVAVEVWGASLMRSFVPSQEWPDAIVSLLPAGVSAFEIETLRDVPGVRRISELLPLQVYFPGGDAAPPSQGPKRKARPNALFLAAEWLPRFRFVEGDWESACAALAKGEVVITEMMARARALHRGDTLVVETGSPRAGRAGRRPQTAEFKIAGVVDLNWHMVTSRGLVRGLNRMPVATDGPVFASFDTVESIDPRPAPLVKMTHLWLEYEPDFLAAHGVFAAGRLVEAEIARRLDASAGAGRAQRVSPADVRLHARDEIADGTLAHGSDLIGAAARIPFIFLAILSIGFVAMIAAEADARRREFAALRAAGATRAQISWLLARSALRAASLGIAFSLLPGAAAGWLFSLKTAAMWPGLPRWFVFPWRIIAEGAAGAIFFALAVALPAARAQCAKNAGAPLRGLSDL